MCAPGSARRGSRPPGRIKWAGIVLLIVGAIVFWTTTPDRRAGKDDDPTMVWTFRLALPVAAVFAIRHTLKAKPPERLVEKLRGHRREPRLDVSALRRRR